MSKTIVNIEDVNRIREELNVINRLKLEDIEWHENGQPLVIAPEALEYWKFCGLSNTGFIEFEIYKETEWQELKKVIDGKEIHS